MRQWMPIATVLVSITLCGCAGMGARVSDFLHSGSWWKASQTEAIVQRAGALEEQGELVMALDHWRLVERIAIDQTQARNEIRRLTEKIAEAVQTHYGLGIEKMKAGELTAARNHFLTILRLDPTFQPARQQIKAGFSPFPLAGYRTLPGDRPDTIAQKVFGNADNAFLVTWFNDLPDDAQIAPDTLLILPKLAKQTAALQPQKQPVNRLDEAHRRLSDGDLEGALALTGQLNPDDPKVQSLIHAIHLNQGILQIEDGLLDEARQSLSMVPDGFAGKDNVLEKLLAAVKQKQLALDMQAAQRRFEENDFQGSLDLATAVLVQSPGNIEARLLAEEARYRLALDLFNRQHLIEARRVLEQADDEHAPSIALKEAVTVRLKTLAQRHYRSGVKHFINEDLKAAVSEWEKALECNPDLEKARENIDNALKIMQKIESLP